MEIQKKENLKNCPYLDTINRSILDFDFKKLCSISLSHTNVYACLVCGKYFQGRGRKSYAYIHSVQEMHHVFLNLESKRFYCLPDDYEFYDSSLEDIIFYLDPHFSTKMIKELSTNGHFRTAYDNTKYLPGLAGLNNIKNNDYCNVVFHLFCNIIPIRDFFINRTNYIDITKPLSDMPQLLLKRFGELIRKLCNQRNFRAHVSPHEMLQAVVLCSKKRFQFTVQSDCVDFITWLLTSLHEALLEKGKSKKTGVFRNDGATKPKKLRLNKKEKKTQAKMYKDLISQQNSIISDTFRGIMRVTSRKIETKSVRDGGKKNKSRDVTTYSMPEMFIQPFYYLACDLPEPPLFPDINQEVIIPQVPLSVLLEKFDGVTEKEYKTYIDSSIKKFEILKLPPYIILVFKRFVKTRFLLEKNPTIVNFPMIGVDFGELLTTENRKNHGCTVYDLIGSIVHDGKSDVGTYHLHNLHQASGKWFDVENLIVKPIVPQLITLSEAYIQVYKVREEI